MGTRRRDPFFKESRKLKFKTFWDGGGVKTLQVIGLVLGNLTYTIPNDRREFYTMDFLIKKRIKSKNGRMKTKYNRKRLERLWTKRKYIKGDKITL